MLYIKLYSYNESIKEQNESIQKRNDHVRTATHSSRDVATIQNQNHRE